MQMQTRIVRIRPSRGVACLAAIAAAALVALPAAAAQPTVEYALGLKPAQPGIDYDQPGPDERKNCTIAMEKQGGVNAWVVRGPSGELLRAFADTNSNRVVDRWSYYKDGIEIYRDLDSDHDAKVDQSRWLNGAGCRWGVDETGDGTIDTWKAMSAEEAAEAVVNALKSRDAAAFDRLVPSTADLEAAGFVGDTLEELVGRVQAAKKGFAEAAARKPLAADARWTGVLTPQSPGVMPAGMPGTTRDVMAHDNISALYESNAGNGQIYLGSLLRCGDAWRPVDAPQVTGAGGEIGSTTGFFAPRPGARTTGPGSPADDERLKPLMEKMREVETKLAKADAAERKPLVARHIGILEEVVAAAADADKAFWVRQVAETVNAAVQEGSFPEGIARLEKMAAAVEGDDTLTAFIVFRLAQARYASGMQQPGAEVEKVQTAWLDELKQFAERYPQSPDAAEAMLQIGIAEEFSGREKEALERYAAIARDFPDSAAARKARGATRRLESVGRPLSLSGTSLDGKQVSLESLRGTPVLVHYWATWCEPCKVDMARIREIYSALGPKRLAVVGIALDTDKPELVTFLKANPIPWPQLHEAEGLDGRLAQDLGVLTLPTMLLLDADGKVVDRNLAITEFEKKLEPLLRGK